MKLGILQTGRTPEEMRAEHGDYDDLFRRLLAGRGFEFETYPVLDHRFPDAPDAAEGWLITGSKCGVYEPHEWIPPLEDFLRATYGAGVPIVGVCFGHQILAQALGGKVEKFSGGWSVGAVDYALGEPEPTTLIAWHQDQVVALPADAEVIGRSDFCDYAMLAYGARALSIQPHPEFTTGFARDLIAARSGALPAGVAERARDSLARAPATRQIADRFDAFFRAGRGAA